MEGKMQNIKIAYIGGGSRGWARNIMADLALTDGISGSVSLYDIDMGAAQMNAVIGNSVKNLEGCLSHWDYIAEQNLDKALEGADFVIISVLPGSFSDMDIDVHYPEKFGIFQAVGDTVGPGGIMRARRAIPVFAGFAEAVKLNCPEAYVINYTNPLTVLTRTLYKVFPGIKAFGCCHEVMGTKRLLAAMVEMEQGIEEVEAEDISVNTLGINHFTWLDEAKYGDRDLMPVYREFAKRHREKGFCVKGSWDDSYFSSANKVKFDLFLRYGLIAAAGDRHLAEFCPGWYLKDKEAVRKWRFNLTPVEWRIMDMEEKIEKTLRIVEGEEDFELKASGEETAKIIRALSGGREYRTNINIPNPRRLEPYPEGAVVETDAVLSKNMITPSTAGKLPIDVANIVLRHSYNQELLVEACLSKNDGDIFKAFANDPLVHLEIGDAGALFNEMTASYE